MQKTSLNAQSTKLLFESVTAKLDKFIEAVNQAQLSKKIYDIWDIEDILRHATFWHTNYADNLEACEQDKTPPLLKGPFTQINHEGVNSLKDKHSKELIDMLLKAHKRLRDVIDRGKIRKMTYKEGGRRITVKRLLHDINSHLNHHTQDVIKSLKV